MKNILNTWRCGLKTFSMVTSYSVFFKANSSLSTIPIAKLPVGSIEFLDVIESKGIIKTSFLKKKRCLYLNKQIKWQTICGKF